MIKQYDKVYYSSNRKESLYAIEVKPSATARMPDRTIGVVVQRSQQIIRCLTGQY